jgi:hypothetical protein
MPHMDILDILRGFLHLGRHAFPAHLCTVQNPREPDVMDSPEDCYHLVFLLDRRFEVGGRLSKMKPYTARDEDGSILYGWVDKDGNCADHGEMDIHDDHQKVVAWCPCPTDFDLRESVAKTI